MVWPLARLAELGREFDALRLAARQGGGLLAQVECSRGPRATAPRAWS